MSAAAAPTRAGIVGLGAMGSPIAQNFSNAVPGLRVFDANPEALDRFVAENPSSVRANALADLADCDVVVLSLPTSDIVDSVLLGPDGLLGHLRPGSIVVDMGSSVPARTQALAERAAEKGIAIVDAPVSGGVARAKQADLAVMVGGDTEAVERVRPLLEATAREVIVVGPAGSGHAAKSLNNLLSASGLVAAAETMLVGAKFGIDPATLLAVINAGSGRNNTTETKYEKFVLSRSFASGFTAELMRKDVGIALDLAREQGVKIGLGEELGRIWNDATDALEPGADQTEIVRYLEEAYGLESP
ncbi:NAD(P)-dependent oxidoreductase [Rhodococcus sp. CX]|uniref:NAD(P)-dependent oxidoreductase n=1 Tax=Rhodococcus sp. CX TaxID=2789880 RepID=UPI0018CFC25A|nr:NAD(P)-dependent oxidoreductase [Rhodococcus sp. CX]MBH0123535.1 NAD(P)-dependent oxidoreductase [Rhodococcus sp. CX]